MVVAAFVLVHMRVYLHSDQFVVRVAVSYKLCASTSAHHAALVLSWFWCRDGIVGRLLDGCERAVDSGGLLATHCGWEHTPMSSETQKAALQCWNQEARPRGPRHSGPTAPVGWAQNTISTPDVFLRFGSATTSKSHLIVFDCVIIQCCRLFLLFLGGKDIIIQPHLFNCSNWSHSNWALPFICNGNDYEIVFVLSSLVRWVRAQWYDCFSRFHPFFGALCFSLQRS